MNVSFRHIYAAEILETGRNLQGNGEKVPEERKESLFRQRNQSEGEIWEGASDSGMGKRGGKLGQYGQLAQRQPQQQFMIDLFDQRQRAVGLLLEQPVIRRRCVYPSGAFPR